MSHAPLPNAARLLRAYRRVQRVFGTRYWQRRVPRVLSTTLIAATLLLLLLTEAGLPDGLFRALYGPLWLSFGVAFGVIGLLAGTMAVFLALQSALLLRIVTRRGPAEPRAQFRHAKGVALLDLLKPPLPAAPRPYRVRRRWWLAALLAGLAALLAVGVLAARFGDTAPVTGNSNADIQLAPLGTVPMVAALVAAWLATLWLVLHPERADATPLHRWPVRAAWCGAFASALALAVAGGAATRGALADAEPQALGLAALGCAALLGGALGGWRR